MTDWQWWEVEYARSGRSKCRKCKEQIEDGCLRIGICMEENDHGGGNGAGGTPFDPHVNG